MTLRRRDFLLAACAVPVALTLGMRRQAFAIDTPVAGNTNVDTPPTPNSNVDVPPSSAVSNATNGANTNLDTPSQSSVFGSPIGGSSSNTKMSTEVVAYQNQPNAGARCATCRFYNASNSSCAQVTGDVYENGWCLMYTS